MKILLADHGLKSLNDNLISSSILFGLTYGPFFTNNKLYFMTTQEAVMTTQDVANRFHELAQTGQWELIQSEFFTDKTLSIEPEHAPGMKTVTGLDAIKEKGRQFGEMLEEMHGGYSNQPVVAGNHFAVAMGMDVTFKGMGRMKMDEIAVYEVKDGKILKEQFFYSTN